MKIKIKSWTTVGTWKYNIENSDDCMICQNEFEIPCNKCVVPSECKPGIIIS